MKHSSVLSCRDLNKSYTIGPQNLVILEHLDFDAREGELIGIVGASGSGKTTLLNMLGGLDSPSNGSIMIRGENLALVPEKRRCYLRNKHLGFVYQFHHLLPEFTALDNVCMPLVIGGTDVKVAKEQSLEILSLVGLAGRVKHKPAELSGGERQRVAIARALVTKPDLVFMDEPTGNLDQEAAKKVHELMLELNESLGICFIVVTHDMNLASQMSRVLRLESGTLNEL